jgi:hypothetical protein
VDRKKELIKKIEQLKNLKNELKDLSNVQDLKQHAYKIFLNSSYGALGSAFYPCFDLDNAEAVTLSGQAVTREMVRYTNEILNKLVNSENEEYVIAGDTDSFSGNTELTIFVDGNKSDFKIKVKELFEIYKLVGELHELVNGTEVAVIDDERKQRISYSINGISKIKNVSRHKVTKDRWIVCVDGIKTEFTSDHSIMVYRDGNVIECKPNEIKSTDFILKKVNESYDYSRNRKKYFNEYRVFDS